MTLLIRPASPADRAAVQSLITASFAPAEPTGDPVMEAVLNDRLLQDPDLVPELTLVAELAGRIVGQVTSSYGRLTGPDGGQRRMVGVGPVAVLPAEQGAGLGSAAMRALIAAAESTGEPALVLLGSPGFYGRFGFVAASEAGIRSPDPAWGNYFQILRLTGFDPAMIGAYRYAAPFDSL